MTDGLLFKGVLFILEKFFGKAAEKGGEKALERASRFAEGKLNKLLNKKKIDFLASKDDFENARNELERICQSYRDIFKKLDELYYQAWPRDKFGVAEHGRIVLLSSKLSEIEREQKKINDDLESVSRKYPSVPLLIGKFMTVSEDIINLLTLSKVSDQLDRSLLFATYVPRVIQTRGGLLFAAKESLEQNLKTFGRVAESGEVPTSVLVRIRQYERLSYIMVTAIGTTLDFMASVQKGAEFPKTVEALSNLVIAMRLRDEMIKELGDNFWIKESEAFVAASRCIQNAFGMLKKTGPIGESIANVNSQAKKAIDLIRKESAKPNRKSVVDK